MNHIVVKSPEQAAAQERKHREREDSLLAAIGLTRADFPTMLGITTEDEHIVVWSSGPRRGSHPPKNLVDVEPGENYGDVIYRFLPLDVDTFAGTVTTED